MFEYNDIDYLIEKLHTDIDRGLTEEEVKRRQKNNGFNILEEKKKNGFFKMFFSQLKDPMIYILFVAIAISFVLREYSDAIVVLGVVIINALIGTFQQIKTEKSLNMLKKLSSHKCNVLRQGIKKQIDTCELVKGDVIFLDCGNSIGADVRIVEANNLTVDESSITGESNAVKKDADRLNDKTTNLGDKHNMGYMSTLVVSGSGKAVVVAIGMNTEIGKIASVLKEDTIEVTPLQKRLFDLGKVLGIITVVICLIMFVISVLEKRNVLDMLISSISLAVAAIPEGLPAVVTIVLAIGVQRLVRVNAIVKRLPSVETLGSVSVVCSDKTGTLTENKLKCVGIFQNGRFGEEKELEIELKRAIKLCNNSYKDGDVYVGSSMENALLLLLGESEEIPQYKRISEVEFNSTRKMMSTLNEVDGIVNQYTKGAYDRIITKCKYIRKMGKNQILTNDLLESINKEVDQHASQSKRILAVAYKENVTDISEDEMVFLGFITFFDPPRCGVKDAILKFKRAGVKTVMITGDYLKTAFSIGKDLGIASSDDECISGDELDKLTDIELANIVDKKTIYARVSPLHKARIVTAYKKSGKVVAMTGDGVNDAPSLKKADIGIAMGVAGNDVAKEAGDMILSDDNFSTIEIAIEEGRTIYNNIKKSVLFLLSSNFAEIIIMLMGILLGLPMPLLAIHILVVNLLTDSIPALALGADIKDKDVMNENPRDVNETLFVNGGLINTIVYGVLIASITMVAFLLPLFQMIMNKGGDLNLASIRLLTNNSNVLLKSQTYAFVVLSLSELFYSLVLRNNRKTIYRSDLLKNKYLDMSILFGILFVFIVVLIDPLRNLFNLYSISILETIILVIISSSIIFFHDLKLALFHMKHLKQRKSRRV